jgi:hypothetical protein
MNTITVENVGPVPNLVIPVQPGGTIIKGYCGKGKSIVLEAIGLGLGARDRGRVAPRVGTKRGEVDCLGVVLGVNASRITRNGESAVASVEEFSVGDLIDPPVKDDEARNRHGIKALLRLSGAEADPERFHHLAGGKENFERLIPPDAVKSTDLVDMALKVKRSFESKARAEEAEAERDEAKAAADRNAGDGLDLKACTDSAKLQRRLEEAAGTKAQLDEQARAARDAKTKAEEARGKLAKATGDFGTAMQDAEKALADADASRDAAKEAANAAGAKVAQIEAELKAAKAAQVAAEDAWGLAGANVATARRAVEAVKRNQDAYGEWQAAIDAAADVYEPDAADLELAAKMVQDARKALETAAVVRSAKERLAKVKAHQERAAEHRKAAVRLREAAKGTDDVLSAAVASSRYSVECGVLMGKLPDGKVKDYFSLSDGERTMIAVAEKIERARAVEPNGERLAIVDMPQRVAQDLPPSVLNRLFTEAAKMNACIVTGMVDDGDLRAEPWNPSEGANG